MLLSHETSVLLELWTEKWKKENLKMENRKKVEGCWRASIIFPPHETLDIVNNINIFDSHSFLFKYEDQGFSNVFLLIFIAFYSMVEENSIAAMQPELQKNSKKRLSAQCSVLSAQWMLSLRLNLS